MARSRSLPRRRGASLCAAAVIGGGAVATSWVSSAAAHPLDELVQQVYVTPAAANIVQIDVELAVGVEVATDFEALVDSDGDGVLSDAEWTNLQDSVLGEVTVKLDGDDVQPSVAHVDLPDVTTLRNGEGVIVYALTISANNSQTVKGVTVSDDYAPDGPNGPIKTHVQMNVTPSIDWPVDVQSITRAPDGREMTTSFAAMSSASTSSDSADPSRYRTCVILAIATGVLALLMWVVMRRVGTPSRPPSRRRPR